MANYINPLFVGYNFRLCPNLAGWIPTPTCFNLREPRHLLTPLVTGCLHLQATNSSPHSSLMKVSHVTLTSDPWPWHKGAPTPPDSELSKSLLSYLRYNGDLWSWSKLWHWPFIFYILVTFCISHDNKILFWLSWSTLHGVISLWFSFSE